ncbi:unnamed protein product, partial [Closterium sp. Naga37s-1]
MPSIALGPAPRLRSSASSLASCAPSPFAPIPRAFHSPAPTRHRRAEAQRRGRCVAISSSLVACAPSAASFRDGQVRAVRVWHSGRRARGSALLGRARRHAARAARRPAVCAQPGGTRAFGEGDDGPLLAATTPCPHRRFSPSAMASPADHSAPPQPHAAQPSDAAEPRDATKAALEGRNERGMAEVAALRREEVGVVVVDHGSRRAESNQQLDVFVGVFQQETGYSIVEPAHMVRGAHGDSGAVHSGGVHAVRAEGRQGRHRVPLLPLARPPLAAGHPSAGSRGSSAAQQRSALYSHRAHWGASTRC